MTTPARDDEAMYRRFFADYAKRIERDEGECWRIKAPRDLRAFFFAGARPLAESIGNEQPQRRVGDKP